ncbi:DUF3368 domain-containing protein [Desulfonatronum thiodismutans]|uniref:DUF3368 domain-containing protein n=1 Tax=Desulfonatronum thiodismutans TaxID=159290 RepID=UPI0004ABDBBF|nr:DUF3368 domain-containing protein [Desulfonatronum thiodismutans]
MAEHLWVVNASPLILLGKIRKLDLLHRLAPRVVVPAAVVEEISVGRIETATRQTLDWVKPYIWPDMPVPVSVIRWDIGAGEGQVLAQCLDGTGRAILDDNKARAAAKAHGIPLLGSLGIVLRAKKAGLIPAARPLIEHLVASGSYLSPILIREALSRVGEQP